MLTIRLRLLHALQPSMVYGWEVAQPAIMAFFVSSAAKLLVCYGISASEKTL